MTGSVSFEANQNSMQQKEQLSSLPYPEPLLDGSIRSKHFQEDFFFFCKHFFGSNFFSSKMLPFRKEICETETSPVGL